MSLVFYDLLELLTALGHFRVESDTTSLKRNGETGTKGKSYHRGTENHTNEVSALKRFERKKYTISKR